MTRSAADHWERGLALFETRLAATIRDYMRARDAGDQFAVKFGAEHICQGLGYLLNRFLEVADGWDSRERWIDGMVGARVEVIASDRIHVAGPMVWGLRADVGGDQWAEPFEAELTIGWETSDLKQYHLHFGDRRELDAKRVTHDFHFLDPGPLSDGELELQCVERRPADPSRGFVPVYLFEMRVAGNRVGSIQLRVGNTRELELYGGHFGYGVEPEHRGHGYAARACRLLLPLARRHGLKTLWITCNPDNIASRRTCERVGAELVEIVSLPPDNDMYRRGDREKCRYRLRL